MNTVKARLDRLEKQIGAHGAGKLIVVRAGPSDEEMHTLLAQNGIDHDDPRHTVVILRTLFEDREGGLSQQQIKAEILSITELK